MRPRALLAATLATLGLLSPLARGAPPGTTWRERLAALRQEGPDGLVIALPPREGAPPEPCVRVERASDLATCLDHLGGVEPQPVLLGPSPAAEAARLTLYAHEEARLTVSVTANGFRVPDGEGRALAFRSPGLLRWVRDRLEAPDRRLLAPRTEADVPPLLSAFARAVAAQGAAPSSQGERLRNGGFEEALTGKSSPAAWDRVDGVTSFWVVDPLDPKAHGRVLLLDTDVYESEWKRRQEEMRKDPDSPPWPKTPVPERDQYATVGGNHGVSVYSDPVPVEPGRPYRLTLAFRTDLPSGTAKAWVRGYGALDTPRGPEERRLFDALTTLRMGSPGWKTHSMVFHPTKNTPAVTTMRVMLYGYWPRGRYAFDDVSLVPISDEEYAKAKETERSDVK